MKQTLLLFIALTQFAAADALEIRTLSGKKYRACEIVRIHPDGVSFRHESGAAKVVYDDLPTDMRQKLGYDPQRAQTYRKEQQKKLMAAESARQKRDAELSAAMALAQQMELARLRGSEEQARAAILAAQAAPQRIIPETVPLGPRLSTDRNWNHRVWISPLHPGGWPFYTGWNTCRPPVHPYSCMNPRRGSTTFHLSR